MMEQVVKQLEEAGILVRKYECNYFWIRVDLKDWLILDRFQGYELIGAWPGEVKYFRTISELIEYVKK